MIHVSSHHQRRPVTDRDVASTSARTLLVTHTYPWPPVGGGAIRVAQTLRALAARGPVDVISILARSTACRHAESSVPGVDRLLVLPRPVDDSGALRRVVRAVTSRRPASRRGDYGELRETVRAWLSDGDYDLVWLGCGTEAFVALAEVLPAGVPVVADLDDLEDQKIAGRLAVDDSGSLRRTERLRRRVARARDRVEIVRWRRLHREVADHVARVIVCSDDDRRWLGQIGVDAAVVPNTYDMPRQPLGRVAVGDPPTLTLIGTLDYRPNVDAATVAVRRLLPLVRRQIPDVQLRLVGRSGPRTADLASEPGVIATGFVDDVDTELARADVVIVPVRFGSGTRIKILEAFAHRIPVVSTSLGAAGLGVVDGVQLAIADDAESFAAACVDLLRDEARRDSLVNAASRFWAERYRPEHLEAAVSSVVADVTGPPAAVAGW